MGPASSSSINLAYLKRCRFSTRAQNKLEHQQVWYLYPLENNNNSWSQYSGIFVRGHYLFRGMNSFPRAQGNCEI